PPTDPPAGRSRTRVPARPAPGRRRQAQRYGSARADSRASLLPLRGHGLSEPGYLVVQRRTAVGPQLALDRREPAVEAVQPRVQAVEPAVESAEAALDGADALHQPRAGWHPRAGWLTRDVVHEVGDPPTPAEDTATCPHQASSGTGHRRHRAGHVDRIHGHG